MTARDRSLDWLGLAVLCVITAAFCWSLAAGMPMPVIHADEGSYLLNAIALGGDLAYSLAGDYYSGYSLLFAPFVGDGVLALHRVALAINVVLVALLPIAYYWLVRIVFPSLGRVATLAAAGLAAFLPSQLYYVQLVFSDNLLVFGYAFGLLALAHALLLRRGALVLAAIAGLLLAWCFLANPRGLVTGAMVVGSTVLVSLRHRALRPVAAVLALCWLLGCLAHIPLEAMAHRSGSSRSSYDSDPILASLTQPENILDLIRNMAGAAVHAWLATVGVASVIVVAALERLWSLRRPAAEVPLAPALVLLPACAIALLATIGMTAVFFLDPLRADHVIYGRYATAILGPVLALGFAELVLRRERWRVHAIGAAIVLVTVALLWWWSTVTPLPVFLAPINVVEGYPYLTGVTGVDWKGLGFGIALTCVVFLALFRAAPVLAAIGGMAYFAAVAWWAATSFLQPEARMQTAQLGFFQRIDAIAALSDRPLCIDLDHTMDEWHFISYGLYLWPWLNHPDAPPRADCDNAKMLPLASAGPFFGEGYLAAAMDVRLPILFLLPPGERRDRALAGHGGLGAWLAKPLPEHARKVQLTVETLLPASLPAGQSFQVHVNVRNASDALWVHRTRSQPPAAAVRLGAQLLPVGGGASIELRADLDAPLEPGAARDLVLTIPSGIAPGRYTLRIAMVNEGVAWFGCEDSPSRCSTELRIE